MKNLLLLCVWLLSKSVFSATGWYQDYIKIDINGAGTAPPTGWYWIGGNPSYATQFAGSNFGVVNTFVITGCDMKYWSDNQDRLGGAFYYKIMSADGTTQIVAPVETIWNQNYLGGNDYQGTTTVSINLLSGLAANTTYQLHIWSKSWGSNQGDSWLNNSGANYVATFTTQQNTFSGIGTWTNAARWNFGVPSISSNAIVAGSATVDSEVTINDLTINDGSSLTVNPANSLTVNGTLTNNAANGIVLKSPSNHGVPGSLITKGSVSGSGTVKAERYIQAYTTDTDGWHLFASPFDNFDITGTNLQPSSVPENEDDFFYWDEAIGDAGTWMNWKVTPFNLMAGKGYLVAYHNDELKEMTGTPFNTDKLFNDLSYENPHPTYHNTWHLLGNPFTCSLEWNSDVDGNLSNDWLLSGIGGIAKLMNVQDGSYSDLGVGDNIPSMQGFFVSIENADNSITIPKAARVHGSKDWYKSSSVQKLLIIANDLETGKKQQSVLQVNELATEGYDYQYDSRFWAWYAPQFYSEAGDELLSTNTLPSLPAETVIPFGFVKNDASNFSIELVESLAGYTVYLSDLKTGTEQNLTDNPVYTFTAEAGDDPNRFLLHLGTVGIDKPADDSQVSILVRDNNLLISGASANAEIVVTNLLGQVVLQSNAGNSGLMVIGTGSLNDGIYVVTVVSGKQAVSKKISIR